MGVFTFHHESTSKIAPARLFKALVLDADNLIPKVVPHAIQSSQVVEGHGGVGTIKNITFGQGSPFKNVTHRVEEVDEQNWRYSYSVIEGDALSEKIEKITHQTQLVASKEEDGGSVIKSSSTYFTKDDSEITEQDVNFSKDKASGLLKAVEAYLLANPQAYH